MLLAGALGRNRDRTYAMCEGCGEGACSEELDVIRWPVVGQLILLRHCEAYCKDCPLKCCLPLMNTRGFQAWISWLVRDVRAEAVGWAW